MRTSTFKRNWMLHYIQPEYLYLPRREEEDLPNCRISFVYNIYKRLGAYENPFWTLKNSLIGYLFKDGILIRDYLGNNRGSIFIIEKKGNYDFIPVIQYHGSFIPEKRKFKIRIKEIKDTEILVYGIDMARNSFTFYSEQGGQDTIQQVHSFIGYDLQGNDEQGYTWKNIRMPDLLMVKCRDNKTGNIVSPDSNGKFVKKGYVVGADSIDLTVTESLVEKYYGDWYNYNYYYYNPGQYLLAGVNIVSKTFYEDYSYEAQYFHYVIYKYSDMYKSDTPPIYPIPVGGGDRGKHYLSTTFCHFEGDGSPPPHSDPINQKIWYHNLFCDQRVCYVPKMGGNMSISNPPSGYEIEEIGLQVIGTAQETSTKYISYGNGPYTVCFDIIVAKYDEEGQKTVLPYTQSGIYSLSSSAVSSDISKWLLETGVPAPVASNDAEGYTRTAAVDSRIMYDPLPDNYGDSNIQGTRYWNGPPKNDANHKRNGRRNAEDKVRGSINTKLRDYRPGSPSNTIIPFIYYNPRQFDTHNDFLRFYANSPDGNPLEHVYFDPENVRNMVFFYMPCKEDGMSTITISEESAAREILETGEERILGEEYRAEGGVFVDGECIIYP